MCLSTVTKEIDNFGKLSKGVGYKVFWRPEAKLKPYGEYYTPEEYGGDGYPVGKWIQSNDSSSDDRGIMSDEGYYKCGFHIFTSLRAAVRWVGGDFGYEVRQVQYRNAHTLGKQNVWGSDCRCIVASEMKIGKVVRPAKA